MGIASHVSSLRVGWQEDILSIFPIERSQVMEEFEKQNEASKAEHDPVEHIGKLKKKLRDNQQLLKQIMQHLHASNYGTLGGCPPSRTGLTLLVSAFQAKQLG